MGTQQCVVERPIGGLIDIISGIVSQAETVDFNPQSDVFEPAGLVRGAAEAGADSHASGAQLNRKSPIGFATYTRGASVAYHYHSSVGGRLNTRI